MIMKFSTPGDDETRLAFDFLSRFARLEYALKQHHFVRAHDANDKSAEVNWRRFVDRYAKAYRLSDQATSLRASPPCVQVLVVPGVTGWETVDLSRCQSELSKVVRLLRTMRNGVFHGGKDGLEGW